MRPRLIKKADAARPFELVWADRKETVKLSGPADSAATVRGWVREFKAIRDARNPRRELNALFAERRAA